MARTLLLVTEEAAISDEDVRDELPADLEIQKCAGRLGLFEMGRLEDCDR